MMKPWLTREEREAKRTLDQRGTPVPSPRVTETILRAAAQRQEDGVAPRASWRWQYVAAALLPLAVLAGATLCFTVSRVRESPKAPVASEAPAILAPAPGESPWASLDELDQRLDRAKRRLVRIRPSAPKEIASGDLRLAVLRRRTRGLLDDTRTNARQQLPAIAKENPS